ncbi:MAG: chemotaxis protein CheR, partial [Lachnospiraceae bacterium]|nr:chemotaxis protein CheR [Lachnospiraceae bacterium]
MGCLHMQYDYDYFIGEILKLTQIDLSSYKQNQMKRRIDAFISRHDVKGYENFIAEIKK